MKHNKRIPPLIPYILFLFSVVAILSFNIPSAYSAEEVKFIQELRTQLEQPVDTVVARDGTVYVLDKKLAKVFVFDEEGNMIDSIADKGSELGQLYKPQSIALTIKGDIIVADTGNSRVQVFKPDGEFSYVMGNYGEALGEFKAPNSVAVDPLGNIYVADLATQRITQFSPRGVYLDSRSVEMPPQDIVIDVQSNMFILMPAVGKIAKVNLVNGNLREITLLKDEIDFIAGTSNLIVDGRGDIYLVHLAQHNIIKIDQEENILFSFGSQGVGRGQFDHPAGITADASGQVYIADLNNKRVQVFALKGSDKQSLSIMEYKAPRLDFVQSISAGSAMVDLNIVKDRGLYALMEKDGQVFVHNDSSRLLGKVAEDDVDSLAKPKSMHVLSDGRILVADTGNHRVFFMNSDGTPDYRFGRKGNDRSEFNALQGVAVNKEGYIFIADTNNHRIQVFNSDGIYLRSFGSKTLDDANLDPAPGTFLHPKDLVFDSKGHLHVLDYRNRRVQVFNDQGQFIKQIGHSMDRVSFKDPVDIAIDEHDYLYVADRGAHAIKIVDPQGKPVMQFGSKGDGRSHFPHLASIASQDGKIYVADYWGNDIKVFNFVRPNAPAMAEQEPADIQTNDEAKAAEPIMEPVIIEEEIAAEPEPEFLYLTRFSQPLRMVNVSEQVRMTVARRLILQQLWEDYKEEIAQLDQDITDVIQIESEEMMSNGQLKMTLAIPRNIVPADLDIADIK